MKTIQNAFTFDHRQATGGSGCARQHAGAITTLAPLAVLLLAAAGFAPAHAAEPASHPVPASVVAERLRTQNPGTRIDSVTPSQLPGLYEVVMGKNIAYVEPSGRYAVFGHVWDMQERRDLTADRKLALDRVDTATLPRELAIRHVRGTGARTLYVFADPQCGYCKALEQTLAKMTDITVYTYVMPLLGAESRRLAGAIQCAADPAAAWSDLMLKAQLPLAQSAQASPATANPANNTSCDSKVDAVAKLAQSLGVTGTPTLVAADGRKSAGAMPAEQLNGWLALSSPVDPGATGNTTGNATGSAAVGSAAVRPQANATSATAAGSGTASKATAKTVLR